MRIAMLTLLALNAFCLSLNGQVVTKKAIADDFEKYKKEQARGFEDFKQKREEELRRMQQEYQDYYNSMVGLKQFYTKAKDTAKVNVINDIIQFETNVSNALGNKIQLVSKVEAMPYSVTHPEKEAEPAVKPANTLGNKIQQASKVEAKPYSETQVSKEAEPIVKPAVSNEPVAEPTISTTVASMPAMEIAAMPESYNGANRFFPSLTPLIKPKATITSPFGFRQHPILGKKVKHNGVDFGSGRGSDIFAAGDGKVVLAEFSKSFGNYVVVEHSDGLSTVYAHMESINVSKGMSVTKGQLIGITGSTGRSTAAHLHYEVRVSGTPINPVDYLKEWL